MSKEKLLKIVFAVDKSSFDSPDHTGVNIKVHSQIDQMEKRGAEVTLERYEWKDGQLIMNVASDTDVLYFRRMENSVKLVKKLKEIKQKAPGIRIVMEIPTYPFKGEATEKTTLKRKINIAISDCLLKQCVDQVVVCSPSVPLPKYKGIPAIEFRNGVDFDNLKVNTGEDNTDIEMICVSGCTLSQGYDRIIKGLNDYYESEGEKKNVNLHVVGTGEYLDYYKELSKEYGLTGKHIFFYGKRVGEELDKVYAKCNVALGHLATHRIGISISPALKIREYGARGIPIVSATMLDIYNDDTKPYILKIDDDETNVDVQAIVDFTESVYNSKDVHNAIRNAFEPYGDWKYTYKDVLDYIFKE